jgi:putative toxin-antitoxin system antitoxin component (TIGR02293 family)
MPTTYPNIDSVVQSLGGKHLLGAIRSFADLNVAVGRGLPYRSLRVLAGQFAAQHRSHVEQIVAPRSTLQRREREGVLARDESERLERIARLTALAEEVWESTEAAEEFLTTAHPHLDKQVPIDLAASDLGTRRVEAILWGLEYSLPV